MSYKITQFNVVKMLKREKGFLQIKKENGGMMDMSDIKKIDDMMRIKNEKDNVKYYMRVFGNLSHPITIKELDKDYYDEDVMDNYLEGKVKNTEKFEKLYSVEIGYFKDLK